MLGAHVKKPEVRCALPAFEFWSGKRVSNSRPQPWQGCALPTELFPLLTFARVIFDSPQTDAHSTIFATHCKPHRVGVP